MKALSIIAVSAAAAAAAVPASAQTFSGPRVEGRVGWDGTSISILDIRDFNGRGTFGGSSTSSDFVYGAELGFDVQAGSMVFGGYAGIEGSGTEETEEGNITFETGRNLTAGGRAGFMLNPNLLAYGKAGISRGRLTPTFGTGANSAPFANYSRNRDGFHFGGGLEFALQRGFYVRGDYTHTKYEEFEIDANTELRFTRNQVTGAIGFRF